MPGVLFSKLKRLLFSPLFIFIISFSGKTWCIVCSLIILMVMLTIYCCHFICICLLLTLSGVLKDEIVIARLLLLSNNFTKKCLLFTHSENFECKFLFSSLAAATFIKRRRQTDNFSAIIWLIKQQTASLNSKVNPVFRQWLHINHVEI